MALNILDAAGQQRTGNLNGFNERFLLPHPSQPDSPLPHMFRGVAGQVWPWREFQTAAQDGHPDDGCVNASELSRHCRPYLTYVATG
ncbi:MAG: hypothetical protein JO115_03565 [Pseudonocardiales bacterium]|nr:hypothetical protein [Pseudonocardiales bacterium]